MRRFALWLVMRGPRLPGPLAVWLFGFAVGSQGTYIGRYPMTSEQPARIDCRCTDCVFHFGGRCVNDAPAITLNSNHTFVCSTYENALTRKEK